MYKDYFPPLEGGVEAPTPFVAVVTVNERVRPEAIMAVCEQYGATSQQSEGKCFWLVFEDEPRRPWPFTEKGLRASVDPDGYIKCHSYVPRHFNPHTEIVLR
jgi:hypothetical protein